MAKSKSLFTQEQWRELNKEIQAFNDSLEKVNKVQSNIGESTKTYIDALKEYNKLSETYNKLKAKQLEIEAKAKAKADELFKDVKDITVAESMRKKYIKEITSAYDHQLKVLKAQTDEISEQVKQTSLLKVAAKDLGKQVGKALGSLPNLIQKGYGQLKSTGLFEMDKAIRTSSLSMGLLGKQSESFKNSVLSSAQGVNKLDGLTAELGVSVEDIAKNQADYSDELGRAVMLGDKGNKAIAELAKGTVLGSEGAAKMAAELDNFGMSAERVGDFMSQALQDASQLGLNAGKVTKNIQHNIKMLNKYNFKDGVKGLAKMAMTASKLGIDMNAIAPMADKLFDIEGAVEMSAQLQVLGGAWSQLADPFKLMYMARNDVDGLTNSLGEAAAASMHLAKDGTIQMSTVEMSRLRKIAEQTGVAYDDIVKAGKNVAKFKIIEPQLGFKADDKEKEFLENVAQLDEKGKAFIEIGLGPDGKVIRKYVDELGSAGKAVIQQQMKEKANLADRAKAAMTFDDKLQAVVNGLKTDLYPIVDIIDKRMVPALQGLVDRFIKEGWADKLVKFANEVGKVVSWVGGLIMEWPKTFATLVVGGKLLGPLIDTVMWFKNGIALAKGFKAANGGFFNGGKNATKTDVNETTTNSTTTSAEKTGGGFFARNGGKMLGGAGAGLLAGGIDAMSADSVQQGAGNVIGGIVGGIAGTFLDGFMGPFGTIIGAELGSKAGGWIGKQFAPSDPNQKTIKSDDSVIKFNPNDKFTKVNDGTMIAGTNANGNASLARSISSMMAPGQNSSTGAISPATTNVNLSDLKVSGSIELKINQNMSRELGENLLHDANFIRNISRLINMSISQNTNMVQKA